MFYIKTPKDIEYSLKLKIINILIIALIFTFISIYIILKCNNLDHRYLNIKEYEDSHSKLFIENFFENPISDMKKFRDLINIHIKDLLMLL